MNASEFLKKLLPTARLRYCLYGFLFGLAFPFTASFVDIWLHDLPISITNFGHIQSKQPLHWIIDMAPLILGWIASIVGAKQDRLQQLNANLETQVAEQTQDLQQQNQTLRQEIEERMRIAKELEQAKEAAEAACLACSWERAWMMNSENMLKRSV